jgi:uncharacterized protein YyaL (SSP411 family)
VPHFEKMLYDNAQLAVAYLEAFQITGNDNYARVVRETLDYVLRDMTGSEGGFYSTEDADSEGVEGKFYTWTPEQITEVLGDEAAATFAKVYDVTDTGNFEEANILNLPKTIEQQAAILGRDVESLRGELSESRQKLFTAREKRIHPHKDDKVITAWNGLMIEALALAGSVLSEPRYLDAARKAVEFIEKNLLREDGRLLHTWRHRRAKVDAYLDDYTYLANGLVTLYECTGEAKYLERAISLIEQMMQHFGSEGQGGFYFTADDQEQLLTRNKEFADNAVPSSNAMAAIVLTKLAKFTGSERYLGAAEQTMQAAVELMQRYPSGTAQMLFAVDLYLGPTYEVVLAADDSTDSQTVRNDLLRRFIPNKVLAWAHPQAPKPLANLLKGKEMHEGQPTLYVCEGFTCQAPAVGLIEINRAFDDLIAKV